MGFSWLRRCGVVFGGVVLPALACGGMGGDEVRDAIGATCGGDVVSMQAVELVRMERDLPAPKMAVSLQLLHEQWILDGQAVPADPAALKDRLLEKAETAKDLARLTGAKGFEFKGELLLYLPPETLGSTVLTLLQTAHEAGFPNVRFVVRTGAMPSPDYLEPAYGKELEAKLDGKPPSDRQMELALEISDLVALCPPAQEAFAAVATASAEMKCLLVTEGMAQALPMCPLTDARKVVTAMQFAMRQGPWEHGVLALSLEPKAPPYAIDPSASWSMLAPAWADAGESRAWWVDATAASEAPEAP